MRALLAASLCVIFLAPAAGAAAQRLASVEDDWPAALATAKARRLPIFVDAWAPW